LNATDATPVLQHHHLAPEDRARAEFYALFARLYARGPDAGVLRALGSADPWPEQPDNPLVCAWNTLLLASQAMDADAADQEYTELFVGVGRCEVNLHASFWLTGFMMEKPLVELRTDLSKLELARRPGATMLEDHLSALCETMRVLVAGNRERACAPVATQRDFFERHLAPWVFLCCGATTQSPLANYYLRVAQLTSFFMAVERDALAIE